jgi:dGTPase
MLSAQVHDVTEHTRGLLEAHAPADVEAVRAAPPLVAFSPAMREQATALKRLLFAALYRHPQVERTTTRAREVLRALFDAYAQAPAELPPEHRAAFETQGPRGLADYVAGMTDRFAAREYRRLHGAPAFEGNHGWLA